MSETALCRERLSGFCNGCGLDLGFGGDAILPTSINVDKPKPYTKVGQSPQHLKGDATNLYWFKDNVLDYVYSSHLLEDFPAKRTKDIIIEWLRVLKPGGNLVLYLPDEQIYKAHCKKTGQYHNPAHKISNFSLAYIKDIIKDIPNILIVHENALCEIYSFEIVIKKK